MKNIRKRKNNRRNASKDRRGKHSKLLFPIDGPRKRCRTIPKKFYESLGDLNTISKSSDMLLKGKIESNGKEEEFYCLQKTAVLS